MSRIDTQVADFLLSQEVVTLGMSTGKDSVAAALVLKDLGVRFIPFFFFHVPDLEFVNRNVEHVQDFIGVEIIQLPHPMLYDYLRHQDFQPEPMVEYLEDMQFPKLTFEDLIDSHMASIGDPGGRYDVVGMRAAESFNRRMVFKKTGHIDHEKLKVYPIADWKKSDVVSFLGKKGYTLTDDYKIWNRSFDGLKYQFLFGVKKHYPDDWERLKEYFPLLDLELFRYKKNIEYFT